MSIQMSRVVAAHPRGGGSQLAVHSLDMEEMGERTAPVVVFDHFQVRGRPFGPHPHAGFSAVSYVLPGSPASLRSRDSLGNDIVVDPGGIVWTQAGRGLLHEELPAEPDRELRGLQIFVNLHARNKHSAPAVLALQSHEVPEWRSGAGDLVRVVVGSFADIHSPLIPIEPLDLLDVTVRGAIEIDVEEAQVTLVYVLGGAAVVRGGGLTREVTAEHALTLRGRGARATVEASPEARLIVLTGAEIREPVVTQGPFFMNEVAQIQAAITRLRAGAMGHLAPARGGVR